MRLKSHGLKSQVSKARWGRPVFFMVVQFFQYSTKSFLPLCRQWLDSFSKEKQLLQSAETTVFVILDTWTGERNQIQTQIRLEWNGEGHLPSLRTTLHLAFLPKRRSPALDSRFTTPAPITGALQRDRSSGVEIWVIQYYQMTW